jgi:hypothetical protein
MLCVRGGVRGREDASRTVAQELGAAGLSTQSDVTFLVDRVALRRGFL